MRGYTTTKGSPDCTSAHYECPGSWTKGQDMSLPTEGMLRRDLATITVVLSVQVKLVHSLYTTRHCCYSSL